MEGFGEQRSLKAIIIGEANVGKTSILSQWLHGTFTDETAPTIAAGLSPVQIMVDGAVHLFHIWDTAGTPQFRSVVPMYCRQAALAIIVFDLTQQSSFDKVAEWHSFVKEHAEPMFILVGNKLDLDEARQVDADLAEELAGKIGCKYIEMSARTKEGINLFARAVIDCARTILSTTVSDPHYAAVLVPDKEESACPC
jgi:small GTP-binding protein